VWNGCGYCENWHILQGDVSRSDCIIDWYIVQDAVSSSDYTLQQCIVQGAVSNSCLYIEAVHCTGYCQ